MKLIKIGRSNQCNIVLPSPKVSALHAELTLLDDGSIILEDKGSTNGTFVGGNKIDANTEIKIQRGDRVVFADTQLSWDRVPDLKRENAKYKQIINIGKDYKNDIRLTSNFSSRYHAMLRITKNNKAMLIDLESKNGTKVNGIPLQPNKEKQIKRGDNIICADEDITENIKPYIPNIIGKAIKIAVAVACVAILVVGGLFAYNAISSGGGNYDKELAKAMKDEGPVALRPATVYVRSYFHYIVKIEDCPISSDIWNGEVVMDILGQNNFLMGTAFFVDREGRMVTNRHIAKPWDPAYYKMFGKDIDKLLKEEVGRFMKGALNFTMKYIHNKLTADDMANYGRYKQYFEFLIEDANKKSMAGRGNAYDILMYNINKLDNLLSNDKYSIDGKMDYITVGYAGRNYTHVDEFERCDVLGDTGTEDIDLGILQLNTKKTPSDIKYIYDINYINTEKLEPLKERLFVLGYPHGELWGLDDKTKSLEPSVRETKCSKEPSRYTFDFQESSQGGSSGSPVIDEKGRLVGVLCTGYSGGPTQAVLAKYVKELYDKVK